MSNRFTLLGADTPNPCKIAIALEEIGVGFDYRAIDIEAGETREDWFRKISPNAKVPVLRDGDLHIWESGAILLYLSALYGDTIPALRSFGAITHSWLFFQTSAVGPTLGQLYHYQNSADPSSTLPRDRLASEADRIIRVLNTRLSSAEYLIGEAYSLADIAMWPWLEDLTVFKIDPLDYPAVARWRGLIAGRPAVQRAVALIYGAQ